MLNKLNYTSAVDIWSIGCIVEEMLTGYPKYYNTKCDLDLLLTILSDKGLPNPQTFGKFNSYPIFSQIGSSMPKFKKPFEPNNLSDLIE